jgi:excisionase family DNA binding protein
MKLDARQAARMLGVGETRIYRWVDAGEIPFTMVHHRPLFHRVELLEWAMAMELPVAVDLYEDGEPSPFADALERGGGGTITAAPEELADEIPALPGAERELISAVIAARAREMFVSRAADWIAMPRANSPIICPATPGLVLLRWAARRALMVRDTPINALFLIVAPTIRRHHELLSRLALALHDPTFRAAALRMGAFAEVVAEARRWEAQLAARRATGAAP